jgi:hypothetical protein
MATCQIKGCKLEAAEKGNYCEGHSAEIERGASQEDVNEAIDLVRKTPWTVLWCVKLILEGYHPGGRDDKWLADTQEFNDAGRLELRGKRFHYKLDRHELLSRRT